MGFPDINGVGLPICGPLVIGTQALGSIKIATKKARYPFAGCFIIRKQCTTENSSVDSCAADSTVHRSGNLRPFAMCLSNPLTQSTLEHVSTLRVGAHCTRARPSTTPSDSPTRHTIRFPFFMKSRAKRSLSLNQCGNLSDCAPVEYRVIISSSIAFSRTHRPA